MTQEERTREKELKHLIYLKNEEIKNAKKQLVKYRDELKNLGECKVKRKK